MSYDDIIDSTRAICDAYGKGFDQSDRNLKNPYSDSQLNYAYNYGVEVGKEDKLESLASSLSLDGHAQPCYYCKELTSSLSGHPGLWPLGFTHPDGTGILRWHHTRCVQDRLFKDIENAPKTV